VIGQKALDNYRYLENVELFQLLTPSARNNTFWTEVRSKKVFTQWLPNPGAAHCLLSAENSIFLRE
jgi:hypothetical protein